MKYEADLASATNPTPGLETSPPPMRLAEGPLSSDDLLVAAQAALDEGWAIFPLHGKEPLTRRGVKDATRSLEEFYNQVRRVHRRPVTGIGGACDRFLVVDVDPRNGGSIPADLPPTRIHWSGRGDGGCHLVYRLANEEQGLALKSSTSKIAPGVDVKVKAGSYVVLPGSIHPDTQGFYQADEGTPYAAVTPALLARAGGQAPSTSQGREPLSYLLSYPPEVGGRNEWLTKVAGHYAKQYNNDEETYISSVNAANALLRLPMDAEEVAKTANSVWSMERNSRRDPDLEDLLNEDNGWLVSGGDCLRTLAYVGTGKERQELPFELTQFDLEVEAKIWDEIDEQWLYHCQVHQRKQDGLDLPLILKASQLADPRQARSALGKRGLVVSSGANLVHTQLDWSSRLQLYLDNQDAPRMTCARHLGWSIEENGYLTLDGVIDSEGLRDYSAQVPSVALRGVSSASVGTAGSLEEALGILREVLHFQDPKTASVFASWWAASLIKQWVAPRVPFFPVMGVEAASGAGKTTGFFALMHDLGGATAGAGHYTPAALRDSLAANLNGTTWVDDLDDPTRLFETIRILTGDGILTKKAGTGWDKTIQFHLCGSLMLSGESLEISGQRALIDRIVRLTPNSPQKRRSHHDPARPQWDDVVAVQDRLSALGGGQAIAGHFLRQFAGYARYVPGWFEQERESLDGVRSRRRDQALTLLVGARALEQLLGPVSLTDGEGLEDTVVGWVRRWISDAPEMVTGTVEERLGWAEGGAISEADNALTLELLPRYLESVQGRQQFDTVNAAMIEPDGSVLFSPNKLAAWWADLHRGQISARLHTADAIRAQASRLKSDRPSEAVSGVQKRMGSKNSKYWRLTGDLASEVVSRSSYF